MKRAVVFIIILSLYCLFSVYLESAVNIFEKGKVVVHMYMGTGEKWRALELFACVFFAI